VSEALVEIAGVKKSFGKTKVLDGVDLEVRRGEVVTIIGPSGGGKTTLLRCVNALETYDSGSIRLDGIEVGYTGEGPSRRPRRDRELARLRAEAGMVFQLFYLFPHLTAVENVMLGLRRVRRLPKAEARARAMHWLERVGLADRAGHLPSQLSGGQQQRVGIARAVAMQPKLLLLDEITSSLDPELVGEVLTVVRRLADEGMTMLVVTHEMGFAREVSEEVVFMEGGRVVEHGPPEQVMRSPKTERLRAFLSRANRPG
jgi:polar amino acid transport system ATP-binding protein